MESKAKKSIKNKHDSSQHPRPLWERAFFNVSSELRTLEKRGEGYPITVNLKYKTLNGQKQLLQNIKLLNKILQSP